jgi:hypothetical protein
MQGVSEISPIFERRGSTLQDRQEQGVTKRCLLSWLTNSTPVYEPKCGGMGGGEVAGSQPMSTAVHMEAQ